MLRSGVWHMLRFTGPIISDTVRALFGRNRRYVPLVGRPGELAFVNLPGAYEGWRSVVPPGAQFDNRIPVGGSTLQVLFYDAAASARNVRCPLLVCVCDNEELMDPAIAVKAAADAPHGIAKHYAADHFSVYHPPMLNGWLRIRLRFSRCI